MAAAVDVRFESCAARSCIGLDALLLDFEVRIARDEILLGQLLQRLGALRHERQGLLELLEHLPRRFRFGTPAQQRLVDAGDLGALLGDGLIEQRSLQRDAGLGHAELRAAADGAHVHRRRGQAARLAVVQPRRSTHASAPARATTPPSRSRAAGDPLRRVWGRARSAPGRPSRNLHRSREWLSPGRCCWPGSPSPGRTE